jgi:ADP-ribose pyrophosphatase
MQQLSTEILCRGKWLALAKKTFQAENEIITWECIEKLSSASCVIILAKLVPSNRFVIIRQFRQAINNYLWNLPAGLIINSTIEKTAIKELQEETGFTGKITAISPGLKISSDIMDSTAYLVQMEVDETAPQNLNPLQDLEPEELIEVHLFTKETLIPFLHTKAKNNQNISAALWYIFAVNL